MTIERIPILGDTQWKELRKGLVTASVSAALFGVHEFESYFRLYHRVAGTLVDKDEENAAIERGIIMEEPAVKLLRRRFPTWRFEQPKTFYRWAERGVGATPDLFGWPPGAGAREFWNLQIKSVEPSIFRKKWRTEKDEPAEPPLWIAVQSLLEAELTGAAVAAVVPFRVGHGVDIDILQIEPQPGVMTNLYAEVAKLRDRIARGDEPAPDYKVDADTIASLYDVAQGKAIDLTGDNRIVDLIDEHARLAKIEKEAAKDRGACRAEIAHKLGDAEVATIGTDGTKITFKRTVVGPKHVAGYSFRALRITDKRERV